MCTICMSLLILISVDVNITINVLVSNCRRRISGGSFVGSEKKYAVYLVMAPESQMNYDTWMCGGALVTPQFILSSAACVIDVDFMYAIAGYIENVSDSEIEQHECTKHKKKRVIYRCYPKKYAFKYDELDYWSYIDIALLKVDSPYNPDDVEFQLECSYIPQPISINYEKKFQEPGTDAIVLGWGHEEIWRKEWDLENRNEKYLKYASMMIKEKELCFKEYAEYPNMTTVIDEYMICALGEGNLDESGKLIDKIAPTEDGCTKQEKLRGYMDEDCKKRRKRQKALDKTRRDTNNSNLSNSASIMDIMDDLDALDNNKTTSARRTMRNFRRSRNGICQNDHGGPLITWKGGREVLIGIASVFKVNNNSECTGPYLFTSTFCTAAFIDCVLTYDKKQNRKKRKIRSGDINICDAPASVRGFETIESHISWKKYPAEFSQNEKGNKNMLRNIKAGETVNDRFAENKKKINLDIHPENAKMKYLEMQRKAAMKRQAAMENQKKAAMESRVAKEKEGEAALENQRKAAMESQAAKDKEREAEVEREAAVESKAAKERQAAIETEAALERNAANKYVRDSNYNGKKETVKIEQSYGGLKMRPMLPIRD